MGGAIYDSANSNANAVQFEDAEARRLAREAKTEADGALTAANNADTAANNAQTTATAATEKNNEQDTTLADLQRQINDAAGGGISEADVNRLIREFYNANQFGNSSTPIADFFPADLSTLPPSGQFDANTGSRGAIPGAGVFARWLDTDGANNEPARILAITNGASPQLWFGWKMGAPAASWKQIGGLTEIADGSITEAKLAQAVRDKLNRALPKTTQIITYLFAVVSTGGQPPPSPVAADFDVDLVPPNGFTLAKKSTSTTIWQTARPRTDRDLWRLTAEIKGTGFDDTEPQLVIAALAIKDDDADAQHSTGLTEAQVRAIVDAAVAAAGLSTAQETRVREIVSTSIANAGHQTESQVRTLIQTAIAGISHEDTTARASAAAAKTAADNAQSSATQGINRARANMASIVSIRNALPDTEIDTVLADANDACTLTANQINQNTFALVVNDAGDAAVVATRLMRAGDVADRIGNGTFQWRIATRTFTGSGGLEKIELFTLTSPDQIKEFAKINGRGIEFGDLAVALQQRIQQGGAAVPASLLRLAHDIRNIIQHPEGKWVRRGWAVNTPAAALFTNDSTTPNSISPEPYGKDGLAIASGSRTNFVRRHADPNSPDNAWPGVSPYAAGQLDITKPANEKNLIFSCILTQMAAQRAANDLEDETAIMFQMGDKKIMRLNQRGLELSIGQTAGGTSRTVPHYLRYDSHILPHVQPLLYNNNIATTIAGHVVSNATGPNIKLTAKQYIADEQVPRTTGSVIVSGVISTPQNFSIPVAGQQPITGTIQYNASNKAVSYRFTGGHNIAGENFTIDFAVEVTETVQLPAGTEWGGMLAAESLSHPEFFQRGYVNEFIFAFVKVHDEPDSANNLMKIVYRINDFSHEQLLHQTRAQLGLDSANVKLACTLQNVARFQTATYDTNHPPSAASLAAFDVNVIGWGQIVRTDRRDQIQFNADVAASQFSVLNDDGTTRKFREADTWAETNSPLTVPKEKLPVSAQVVSGILLPRVITVPHFTAQTADIDLGFKLDGEGGLRSQFEELVIPVEYKVGRNPAETGRANHRFHQQILRVPLDALPAESSIIATGARWDRYLIIDAYPNTLQRIALHIWQENQRQGNILNPIGNIHINLVYWNNSDGRNHKAPLPAFGNVGHYDGLSVAAYHDPNARQVYLMPRNAAIVGDTGPGVAAGGNKGQALVKTSSADFDTSWAALGIENSDNLLTSAMTVSSPTTPFAVRTIDLTGAKSVVVVIYDSEDDVYGVFIIPINQLVSAPSTISLSATGNGVVLAAQISFPVKTATAAAQIRFQYGSNAQISFVGKITG